MLKAFEFANLLLSVTKSAINTARKLNRACRRVFGFANLGLKRIIGLVIPENIASVRVLEKTELRYSETVTLWGHQFSKRIVVNV